MMSKHKLSAIVISANFKKAYPIIMSLFKRRFYIIGLFYLWRSPLFSKYLNKKIMIPNPYLDEKGYILNLKLNIKKYNPKIVIPVGFIDNIVISKYRNFLPKDVIIPVPELSILSDTSNKLSLVKYSKIVGFKYPETLVSSQYSPEEALDYIGLPMVIKGISDASNPKYFFTEEQFKDFLKFYNQVNLYIYQRFISGVGVGYFTFSVDGEPIAEFLHRRVVERKPSGGPSIVACAYNDPEALRIGRHIIRHLKWTGILMVEMRKEYETGDYYVVEFNPKFWGSLELSFSRGIDFPGILVDMLLDSENDYKLVSSDIPLCFTWILDGIKYLKENPKVWLGMLSNMLKNGAFSTDLHLYDFSELAFSLFSRLINLFFNKIKTLNWSILYKDNLRYFLKAYRNRDFQFLVSDLDGTIVHLNVDWQSAKNNLIRRKLMKKHEYIIEALSSYWINDRNIYREVSDLIEKFELEAVEKIGRDSFLSSNFRELKREGYKIGIVSKQPKTIIYKTISRLGIKDYVDSVVGRDEVFYRRDQLKMILKDLVAEASNTILCGDSLSDLSSAGSLGIWPIAITTNPYRFQQYMEYGVLTFNNLNDFISIIKYLNERG